MVNLHGLVILMRFDNVLSNARIYIEELNHDIDFINLLFNKPFLCVHVCLKTIKKQILR